MPVTNSKKSIRTEIFTQENGRFLVRKQSFLRLFYGVFSTKIHVPTHSVIAIFKVSNSEKQKKENEVIFPHSPFKIGLIFRPQYTVLRRF